MNGFSRTAAASGVAACTLALAGCASAPMSFVDAMPTPRTDTSLYPVRVVSVDGSTQFGGFDRPVQLYPGTRRLVLEAAPGRSAKGSVQKSFVLQIEPCKRYYLAAKRQSPMDADWSLVEGQKDPVAGCDVKDELRKAELVAAR